MRFWPFRGRPAAAPPPANDLLATEELLRKNVEDLLVVRERQIRGGVIVFRGELLLSPSRAVDALLERFRVFGYTPFIHADGDGVVVQAWPLAEVVERPRVAVNVVLFVLTCASTLLAGVPFACTLLAILGVHEFGHYFTARHYGAQVSLPFFIPAPPPLFLFGTMGAIIRMRSPARDRNSLFDIAAAGPLAGLAVALPALVVGLMWSQVATTPANAGFGGFGYSLLTRLFVYLRFGALPDGTSIVTHPMADAAWVGCFVTALNLVPVGQLDGGRIAYALFGARHRQVSLAAFLALLVLGAVTG